MTAPADPGTAPARRSPWSWAYELTMAGLALVVVWLLVIPDGPWVRRVNLGIWAVFVADYVVRLVLAHDRRAFVRGNIPDLVAAMPLDALRVARLARLARLVRLFRAGTVLWRVSGDLRGVLATNGLDRVLLVASGVVVAGGTTAWALEPAVGDPGDGLWWALVTATTVGYGDIAPVTTVGRLVAVVLMLVGIGTLGMVTGSISTYFLSQRREHVNPQVAWVRDQLSRWDDLAVDERRRLAAMLAGLAEAESSGPGRRP